VTRRTSRAHRSPGSALVASLVAALVCLAVSGCKRDASRHARGASSSESAPSDAKVRELETRASQRLQRSSDLPARAEIVALADELAVAAANMPVGEHALRLTRLAADLRARMWRVGHAEADAREAIELYRSASKSAMSARATDEACRDQIGQATIAAELARAPAVLFRELYSASKRFDGCDELFAGPLKAVEAFRPSTEELAALDSEARKTRIESNQKPPSGDVTQSDESGVVLTPGELAGPRVKVVAIQPYGSKDRARVVVTLSGPTGYRVGELSGPRLFVDLDRAEPSRRQEIAVGGLVERVRQAARKEARGEPVTRVVLDLSSQAYRRVFYLPEPFRVVIDVATHPPEKARFDPGAARTVSRVALDAGHGGSDPGAIGPSGLREKDVTLDIAHLAAPVLSRELGILTLLTRDDDRLVPLDERAARANAFHADLFVSIHCNASDSGGPHGVMSFVLDTSRDEAAEKIAARENATSLAASSQVASIASRLRLSDNAPRSTRFAELLQRSTMASLAGRFGDASDQGVKTAGFLVLVGAEMPSVLFETSFISNPAEEKRLATADYRQKIADGIVNAVRAYREGR
jgi:N-acetylmuramoyl-L-alanine amidase